MESPYIRVAYFLLLYDRFKTFSIIFTQQIILNSLKYLCTKVEFQILLIQTLGTFIIFMKGTKETLSAIKIFAIFSLSYVSISLSTIFHQRKNLQNTFKRNFPCHAIQLYSCNIQHDFAILYEYPIFVIVSCYTLKSKTVYYSVFTNKIVYWLSRIGSCCIVLQQAMSKRQMRG